MSRLGRPEANQLFSFLLALALLLGFALTGIPYVRSEPGSTYDALGKIDGINLIDIENSEYSQYPTSGELHVLTVNSWGGPYGPLVIGDAIRAVWDRSISIEPADFLYPEPIDPETEQEESEFQFSSAGNTAIAVALSALEIPLTSQLRVIQVDAEGPAAKLLKANDLLVKFDGEQVTEFTQLTEMVKAKSVGESVEIEVLRDSKLKSFTVKLGQMDDGNPRIGVVLFTEYSGPMDIKVHLENVGGPSAGLAFTLAIFDKLTPGELLSNRTVAVTGTIEGDGSVGAIGGLPQKIAAAARAGATWMLIPADNCRDLPESPPSGLSIIPVDTFQSAVSLLENPPSQLPTCTVGQGLLD